MGATLNGIVSPAKTGFLVEMWWAVPGIPPMKGAWKTTDAQGRVQFRPGASSWPVTFYLVIPSGQTVDGVPYGGYTSEKKTLYDTQTADFYLYPKKITVGRTPTNMTPYVAFLSIVTGLAITRLFKR